MILLRRLQRPLCQGLALVLVLLHSNAALAIVAGQKANPGDWASTLLLTGTSRSLCSATVVGPRTILTAGYCVRGASEGIAGNSGNITGERSAYVRVGRVTSEIQCELQPSSNPSVLDRSLAAICLSKSDLHVAPERIDTGDSLKAPGTEVVLAGLGCGLPGGIDRELGVLRTGRGKIVVAGPTFTIISPSARLPPASLLMISGAVLCPGDAGGGTFKVAPDGSRVLLGVNISSDNESRSWVAPTSSNAFLAWAKAWSARNDAKICGLVGGDDGCLQPASEALAPAIVTSGEPTAESADKRLSDATDRASASALGDVARTLNVFTRKGESIKETVLRACGGPVGNDYLTELRKLLDRQQLADQLDAPMTEDREVDILPCPVGLTQATANQDYIDIEVRKGDTAYGYFLVVLKRGGPNAIWRDFRAPPDATPDINGEYFLQAFQALNSGINVDSMVIGSKVRVPLHPTSAASDVAVGVAPGAIKPLFALQSSDPAQTTCKPAADFRSYPFDLSLLLDVLAENRAIKVGTRSPTTVVIADSGLFGVRSGVFRDTMLAPEGDWSEFARNIAPLNRGPEPEHGTEVATLALGGPMFARLQAVTGAREVLVVKRIYRKYSGNGQSWYDVDQNYAGTLQGVSDTAGVVNLSLDTETQMDWLKLLVQADHPELFVVAAGNWDGPLGPSSNKYVYPAVYGGPGSPSILVVGAVDGTNTLADFSNSGKDFVEIAAPGCQVPTFDFDTDTHRWIERPQSGTSISAPLVSFAAALAKSERVGVGWHASDVKRRLLVSADLHNDALADSVADGRILNIVKAVSIYQDVVELKLDHQLLFGDLTFIQGGVPLVDGSPVILTCDGKQTQYKVSDLLKLAPNWDPAHLDGRMKVYVSSPAPGSLFGSILCEVPPDLDVTIKDQGDAVHAFSMNQIQDITRRSN